MTVERKFPVGSQVRVVRAGTPSFWYASRIGEVFTVGERYADMADGFNFIAVETDSYLADCDVELAYTAGALTALDFSRLEELTLAQILARLDEVNTTIKGAQAELETLQAAKLALLAGLKVVGITIAGEEPVTITPVYQTFREANNSGNIRVGDKVRAVDRRAEMVGSFTMDREYTVLLVDTDESLRVTNDNGGGDYNWIWSNEPAGEYFIHIPA